jgi:acyl-CoA thioesterase-1
MLTVLRATALVVLVSGCLFSAAAQAGDGARTCRAQADLTKLAYALPRTARRLANREPLTIVALGSSSTAGAGASTPDASYPSRLAAALRAYFPSNTIKVLNRGVNGEEVRDMLNRFDASVAAEKPDLVLWQVGTNAVLHDKPATMTCSAVREGVVRIKALGADVILIDTQFAPDVLAKSENEQTLKLLAVTAKETSVGLFPRFALMRRWREIQHIPFETFLAPDHLHMNDWSYGCLAKLLADAIVEAATRSTTTAGVGPNVHALHVAPPQIP